jgi:biotin operon repressor
VAGRVKILVLRVSFLPSLFQTMRTSTMPPKVNKPNVSSVSDTLAKEQLDLEREKLQLAREMLRSLGFVGPESVALTPVAAPATEPARARARRESTPAPAPQKRARRRPPRAVEPDGEKETSAHITDVNYASGLERQKEILDALKASKHGAMTQPELAEKLSRSRGNIKHHLDNMAARGDIVRTDAKIGGHLTTVAGLDFNALAKWHAARQRPNRA